jgi:hypothetical protein
LAIKKKFSYRVFDREVRTGSKTPNPRTMTVKKIPLDLR